MAYTKAYREMIGLLLTPEDRRKFEWSIGAMLDGGPRNIVVLIGDARTGKTTLTRIVRKILFSPEAGNFAPRVTFLEWSSRESPRIDDGVFAFVEVNNEDALIDDSIIIRTTGARMPVNKHYVLMQEIDSELSDIADHCVELYRELGEDYYRPTRENNR